MSCPNCGSDLVADYYLGRGRVVGCTACGLRGPRTDSADDDIRVALALFEKYCRGGKQNTKDVTNGFVEMLLELESDDARVDVLADVSIRVCFWCGNVDLPCSCMKDVIA